MIVNGNTLLNDYPDIISPMVDRKLVHEKSGTSYGLTECGYDIRVAEDVWLFLGRRFVLTYSMEKFRMPPDLMGRVLNKSTWARMGVDASMTTNIEPGWVGFLTIELRYSRALPLLIPKGSGIAQIIFERIVEDAKYNGKYQNQGAIPQPAILSVIGGNKQVNK